ncbi:hypothetical protein [Comamonas koreensis]|uniref:Uncharacterized protein n=1 Tax=Comamonas koreensis TaxID=160825 RepID=A0AAW4XS68_9BURK|nr:hypothetical protein [Comamonas koreensis]MCD2164334.1 hypothetical protein [Comamonas koreensis]
MTTPDPSREAFERWAHEYCLSSEPNYSKFTEADCRAAHDAGWQAAMAHKSAELQQAHEARRQAQAELADMQEKRNRIGLDIDRALRGEVNEQSPIAGRLKLIAQKAGQWKPWPMG